MSQLSRLNDFKTLLDSYSPNAKAVKILQDVRLALLVGPTSAGRNTIIRELLKSGRYSQVVSDNTRSKRVNNDVEEQNGVEYYFKSEDEFIAGLENGDYIEAEIIHNQQVCGVRTDELIQKAKNTEFLVNEVETEGAEKYKQLDDSIELFFVIPPNFEEWMNRMTARGNMEPDEVKRRLQSAEHELQHALDTDFYTYVINESYQVAATEIMSVMDGRTIDQEEHKERAWNLLNSLKSHLSS